MIKKYKNLVVTMAIIVALSFSVFTLNVSVVRAEGSNSDTIRILELFLSLDIFTPDQAQIINLILQILRNEDSDDSHGDNNGNDDDDDYDDNDDDDDYDNYEKIEIETNYSLSQYGDYNRYNFKLSGGSSSNPVNRWKLTFSCPDKLDEFIAKVAGNVCDLDEEYVFWNEQNSRGDAETSFSVLRESVQELDPEDSRVQIFIKAYDEAGNFLGSEKEYIDLYKG